MSRDSGIACGPRKTNLSRLLFRMSAIGASRHMPVPRKCPLLTHSGHSAPISLDRYPPFKWVRVSQYDGLLEEALNADKKESQR